MKFQWYIDWCAYLFSDWIVPSYCYICGVLLWKPLLAGIFAGGHFVYDSIRKNAGNTLVGFPGCFGRQLLLEH